MKCYQWRNLFEGENILDLDPEERAHLGLFMSFQYPLKSPGSAISISCMQLDNAHAKALQAKPILSEEDFVKSLKKKWILWK